MKKTAHKGKWKKGRCAALAGLLAAGLLLWGGATALAAGDLVLGANNPETLTGSEGYTGDMILNADLSPATQQVNLQGAQGGNVFQNLFVNGNTVLSTNALVLTINTPLTFAGGATISGRGPSDNPSGNLLIRANTTFGGTVVLDGQVLDNPTRPGGHGSINVSNNAVLTAPEIIVRQGDLGLGAAGTPGEIVANVTLNSAAGGAYLLVQQAGSKLTGNLTLGAVGGGTGTLVLVDQTGTYQNFEITGDLILNNINKFEDNFYSSPEKTVEVGPGKTLTVGGTTQINNDSILSLASGGALASPNVQVNSGTLLILPGSSAAAVTGNLNVNNGGTVNIGSSTAAGKLDVTGNADFQAGSTLSLFAAPQALNITGNLDVADGSKLLITGGDPGDYNDMFAVSGSVNNAGGGAWTGANVASSTDTLQVSGATWNGTQYVLTVTSGYNPAGIRADVNSNNTGVKFYSRALDERYNGKNRAHRHATVEGGAELAQVAAVPGLTLAAADAGVSAITSRTSFAAPVMGGARAVAMHSDADGTVVSGMSAGNSFSRNGLGLWLMPLYQNSNVWGMKAGDFKTGYHSSLGGIAIGADYTFQEMFRVGASFNVGGGYAKSSGDMNTSENHATFWGVNLYGGWAANNFGIGVEGGYTAVYNQLRQDVPASMQMGPSLEADDVHSRAWHAGLRAEYRFETPVLDIIPHAGVRWTGIHLDGYHVKNGGGTVFKVDDSYQSIWTFPVGVTFAKTFSFDSGWTFRPQVDAGVIPAAGDVKSRATWRVPNAGNPVEYKVQQADYVTFDGTAGFEVANGKGFSIGLNYNLQLSEHRTGHGVFGTLRYEF
ncbi:MAG: autotransporter outer membrane beta-barrel domain-containing protein [Deltaproteobacteria bacterium]|nr:autotransporter outer membrane beta-barrel domain-containing protein [Deltaproteobacteria bacterium]